MSCWAISADVDLGDDRVVVADDAGKQLLAVGQRAQEVVVDLPLDGLGHPAALAQLAQRGGSDTRGRHAQFESSPLPNCFFRGHSARSSANGHRLCIVVPAVREPSSRSRPCAVERNSFRSAQLHNEMADNFSSFHRGSEGPGFGILTAGMTAGYRGSRVGVPSVFDGWVPWAACQPVQRSLSGTGRQAANGVNSRSPGLTELW